ncbi:E3 ubiquitin-protein ligase [Nymphaea thermarum]|nr:E3 ubiquitin-protein ligase [Nymphaea thermarum]
MGRMEEPMVLLELQVRLLVEEAAAGLENERRIETHYFLMDRSSFDSTDNIWGHICRPLCANRTGNTAVACLESVASSLCSSIQSHVLELLASPDVGAAVGVIQATWEIEIKAKRLAGEAAGPGPSTPASTTAPDGDGAGEKVCVVCMEKVSEPTAILTCSHQYHEGCILRWLKQSRTCPLCRTMIPASGWFASTFNVCSSDAVPV